MLLVFDEHAFSQLQKGGPFQGVFVGSFDELMGRINENRWDKKLDID